jgi:hypothetical protein
MEKGLFKHLIKPSSIDTLYQTRKAREEELLAQAKAERERVMEKVLAENPPPDIAPERLVEHVLPELESRVIDSASGIRFYNANNELFDDAMKNTIWTELVAYAQKGLEKGGIFHDVSVSHMKQFFEYVREMWHTKYPDAKKLFSDGDVETTGIPTRICFQ